MTANVYRQLLELLPQDPLLTGEVLSMHSDGTVSVEMPGGGVIRVRGVFASGDRVFIQAGQAQGLAPDLAFAVIEI